MNQIIECVPNISEGRDKEKINLIVAEIEKVKDVKVLNVDPGYATNRTVITFVGSPKCCRGCIFINKKSKGIN